ncbi:hypothetical protein ACFWY5_34995 [Nonomuraea sp. NPDC059007]|uniref:hypothetical protein n=1 Tax=Nonomuraea sp. NPDC059007 TaxID=3346692 RepID=UPI0036AC0563
MLSVSAPRPRRHPPVFWWWLAASYALWEIVWEVLTPPRRVLCAGAPISHPVGPVRRTAAALAEMAADVLFLAGPFLLVVIALYVTGRDNARVHLMAAVLGFGLVALPEALAVAGEVLRPPAEPSPGCLPEPAPFRVLPVVLSWVVSPLTMVMLAGAAGLRVRPDRGSVLRLCAALGVIAIAVPAVRILPERLAAPPVADDGTSRYALIAAGYLETVNLDTGRVAHEYLPYLGRRTTQINAVAAGRDPGDYVVSVTLRQGRDSWSPRGFVSRIHRLTVDADGQAKLGQALSGKLNGSVDRIVLSPEGRVAYSRRTEGRDRKQATYVGVLGPGVEWRVAAHGFYWKDAHTLVLPDDIHFTGVTHPPKPESVKAWEGAIDVRTPASGPSPAALLVRAPRENGSHTLPHPLPDGRTLRVRKGSYEQPSELHLYEGDRKVTTVLTLTCGEIVSMALDRSGRHLLVGKDNENEPTAGNRPCGGKNHELLRVGLTPTAAGAFPHRVVWRGDTYAGGFAW